MAKQKTEIDRINKEIARLENERKAIAKMNEDLVEQEFQEYCDTIDLERLRPFWDRLNEDEGPDFVLTIPKVGTFHGELKTDYEFEELRFFLDDFECDENIHPLISEMIVTFIDSDRYVLNEQLLDYGDSDYYYQLFEEIKKLPLYQQAYKWLLYYNDVICNHSKHDSYDIYDEIDKRISATTKLTKKKAKKATRKKATRRRTR